MKSNTKQLSLLMATVGLLTIGFVSLEKAVNSPQVYKDVSMFDTHHEPKAKEIGITEEKADTP